MLLSWNQCVASSWYLKYFVRWIFYCYARIIWKHFSMPLLCSSSLIGTNLFPNPLFPLRLRLWDNIVLGLGLWRLCWMNIESFWFFPSFVIVWYIEKWIVSCQIYLWSSYWCQYSHLSWTVVEAWASKVNKIY